MSSSSTSIRLRFEVGTRVEVRVGARVEALVRARVREGLGGIGPGTGARVEASVAARADSGCVGAGIELELAEKFASESSWDGPGAFAAVATGA